MKRELIIIGAVLVPFAVLVAAGFYFSPEPVTAEETQPPAPRPARGERATEPVLSAAAIDAGIPRVEPFPPELAAPLSAILPEVNRCFADQNLKRRREVKVRFTPTRDGGFERVEVDEQNPFLAACLEDVFAELSWQPDGHQTFAPATHTFSFDPSPD